MIASPHRFAVLSFCILAVGPSRAADEVQAPPVHSLGSTQSLEGAAKDLLKSMKSSSCDDRRRALPPDIDPEVARQLLMLYGCETVAPQTDKEESGPRPEPAGRAQGMSMSLSDARFNFKTVVENKLAADATEGTWPYRDRKTGKTWPLAFERVDEATLEEVGPNRFAACVLFKRKDAPVEVDLDFTVDFSDHWRVDGVKLHLSRSAKPQRRARPQSGGRGDASP